MLFRSVIYSPEMFAKAGSIPNFTPFTAEEMTEWLTKVYGDASTNYSPGKGFNLGGKDFKFGRYAHAAEDSSYSSKGFYANAGGNLGEHTKHLNVTDTLDVLSAIGSIVKVATELKDWGETTTDYNLMTKGLREKTVYGKHGARATTYEKTGLPGSKEIGRAHV